MSGVVLIHSRGETSHNGVTLSVDGAVNLQLSPKNVGLFEAFYNSIKVSVPLRFAGKYCTCDALFVFANLSHV